MENILIIVPVIGILSLLFAIVTSSSIGKKDAGNDRMQEIAGAIAEGARAFLMSEYKVLLIFVAVMFVVIGLGLQNWMTAICFLVGSIFSVLSGYLGMGAATKANVRTTSAAMHSGMNSALSVAFSGGSVMGLAVVGLGLFGISIIYVITGNADILFGFSLGASSIALFARVGGGIYTK
ncbi:sodium/proton-translocating pyrophosphatase, partial [Frisingicoccus sp.]